MLAHPLDVNEPTSLVPPGCCSSDGHADTHLTASFPGKHG